MLRKVLFPLDGSAAAECALSYARTLQNAFDCDIVLLRVVDAGPDPGNRLTGSVEWRFREAEARDYLAAAAARLAEAGVRAETMTASGRPAAEILRAAENASADLIVLTEAGEGGGGVCGTGGTSHQVVSAAETSLLLVRDPVRSRPGDSEDPVERIVVPVDGSSRGDWALSLAASIAEAGGIPLTLLHVVQRPVAASRHDHAGTAVSPEGWADLQRENGELQLEERRRRLAGLSTAVKAEVVVAASVPRAIAAMATEGPETLLILSAHGQSGASGWPYGSTVSSLLAHGRVSTLVFQDLPRRTRSTARSGGWAAGYRRAFSRPPA
jgi:nucleotide-binding universal stress UspA family protein